MKLLRIFALFIALIVPLLAYDVTVTGRTTYAVWGTGIYTNDSDIATAAVHAGLITSGQTAVISVTPLPGQSSYTGSTANGVTTYSYGYWGGSISLALAASGGTAPTIQLTPDSGITLVNGVYTAYTSSQIGFSLAASDVDGDLAQVYLMGQGSSIPWASWTASGSSFNRGVILTTPATPTTWVLQAVVNDLLAHTGDSGWYTIQIVAPGNNVAPTATISGPTALTTGQNGTWNYSASDANANLYRWRLVIAGAPQSWNYISGGSVSSSLTMSFASAGTHAIGVEVEDTNGATGSAAMNVVVSNPPSGGLPYTVSSSYASHVYYPAQAPNYTYLTDGIYNNTYYGYGSDDSLPNWLMADFGSAMRITKVHVGGGYLQGWGFALSYSAGSTLQYSNDATNWTTAHTYSSGFSSAGTSVTLDIVARYWRLYRTNRLGTTEFRFEGTSGGAPTYTVNLVNGTTNQQTSATVTAGTSLPIVANIPPTNYLFSQWTMTGVGTLASTTNPTTSFTVGNGPATVTANHAVNVAPTASISAAGATTLPVGSTATILYSSTDANANLTQWRVSLLPNSAQWTQISGGSQSAQFNYTFPTAGTYTFQLEVVDSLGATATGQVAFTVQSQLSVSPNPVAAGQTFNVSYTGAPSTSSWIGIYTPSGSDTSPLKTATVPNAGSGSRSFTVDGTLPPGTYNARLFQATSGYVKLGTSSNFTVQSTSTYTLTVNNGTGGASGLTSGTVRNIAGTIPAAGGTFSSWTLITGPGMIGNPGTSSTTFTMGAGNATVQANYVHSLTVTNGTGGGSGFAPATVRNIAANSPPAGQAFSNWTLVSGPGTFGNANSASTTFTMGSGNATIQANYAPVSATVTVSPSNPPTGSVVTVAYTGAATTNYWIGLYRVGYNNNSPFLTAIVPNTGSGSVSFTLNGNFSAGGNYQARLFSDLGYTLVATSNLFVPQAATQPDPSNLNELIIHLPK